MKTIDLISRLKVCQIKIKSKILTADSQILNMEAKINLRICGKNFLEPEREMH